MTLANQLNRLLTVKSQANQFSGVVYIQRGDEPLFAKAYGYAHRGWRIENRLETRFRLASISKMFTAVAVLQLIDAGKLAFDTSVVECLALRDTTLPPTVTVEHLLTMTSGIADWFDEAGDWAANWAKLLQEQPIYLLRRNEDYLPLFLHSEPLAAVGERYRYNGAGYILLGLIVQKLSGLDYFEAIRQHIFAKAGMTGADFLALDDVVEDVAEGYIPLTDGAGVITGWRKNIYTTTPEGAADGGATATAADLIRFSQTLRGGELLSPALTTATLTPKVLERTDRPRGYLWKYGYGLMFILDDEEQIVRYGHTGEEDGVSCRLYHYPTQNLDVVILGNQSGCAGAVGWAIHDLILGKPARPE